MVSRARLATRLGSALLVALLGVTWTVAGANASAAVAPLTGLGQARSELSALAQGAAPAAVRQQLESASGDLAGVTASWLWIDQSHLIAPGHGGVVFAATRVALRALEPVPAGSVPLRPSS